MLITCHVTKSANDLIIWILFVNKCAVTMDGGVFDGAAEAQKTKTVGTQL